MKLRAVQITNRKASGKMNRYIFGNPDLETRNFAIKYLGYYLWNTNDWRYRHTVNHQEVDSIIFSFKGELIAELVVESSEDPNADDIDKWPKTRKVFIIKEIRLFRKARVRASDVGLTNYQFGKNVSDKIYDKIIKKVGGFKAIISSTT